MGWDWRGRRSIPCAGGRRTVLRRRFRTSLSARYGGNRMEQAENPSRERILERVRKALRKPAPRQDATAGRQIFPPVTNALERFQKECQANKTECLVTSDVAAS